MRPPGGESPAGVCQRRWGGFIPPESVPGAMPHRNGETADTPPHLDPGPGGGGGDGDRIVGELTATPARRVAAIGAASGVATIALDFLLG